MAVRLVVIKKSNHHHRVWMATQQTNITMEQSIQLLVLGTVLVLVGSMLVRAH